MLEVRIRKVDLAIPYAYNAFRYGAGFLTDDFPYARTKIVPLDARRMIGLFAPGVEVPLAPFFGSMGVAPPPAFGRYDSAPPTINGGNMDDKALVAGTTLFLPVHVAGALFQVGDGHAAQGNGEVDITALETSLTGAFEFVLHKHATIDDLPLPRLKSWLADYLASDRFVLIMHKNSPWSPGAAAIIVGHLTNVDQRSDPS